MGIKSMVLLGRASKQITPIRAKELIPKPSISVKGYFGVIWGKYFAFKGRLLRRLLPPRYYHPTHFTGLDNTCIELS